MGGTSRFHAAISMGQACEVQMNAASFISFQGPRRAIGTRNLNGCIAVAIVSEWGAILAHIPPMPYKTHDPNAGMQNLEAKMTEIITLYQQNSKSFPSSGTSLIVAPLYENQVALSHHLDCIRGRLLRNGLDPNVVYYQVSRGGHFSAAQGTCFIDAR